MAKVEFAPRARADLVRLRAWLADKDEETADRAVRTIVERIGLLEAFPLSAPRLPNSEIRELQIRFGRYGYVARYGVRGDAVVIARIFHGREDR
ncbi:MAG TPA: type II toxin-antitoxin system RelE/ParE family toxin [Caulobacteraceae bacterium]|jgi:plasmid stabilization system protein ParE